MISGRILENLQESVLNNWVKGALLILNRSLIWYVRIQYLCCNIADSCLKHAQ